VRKIFRNHYDFKKKIKTDADVIFPAWLGTVDLKRTKPIYWIPDFQEHFLPAFFTPVEVVSRKNWQSQISKSKQYLILSSQDALKTFIDLYPKSTVTPFVLNFAVTLPSTDDIDSDALVKKYSINEPFFMCPNQFWIHKNHMIVLEAISILKQRSININMVFTGKEADYRSPDYSNLIRRRIVELDIEDNCKLLGFIDRKELVKLIVMSAAVIQPSKFEGWSTSIEDAKAMNKLVIASDINVHREQLVNNAIFFNCDNAITLANAIENILTVPCKPIKINYENEVRKFGANLIEIITSIVNNTHKKEKQTWRYTCLLFR
jgi:glycosyltransferase involved in cell wall biosynthesis